MLTRIVGTAAAIALFGALTVLGASQRAQAQADATCQASPVTTSATHIERR